MLLHLDFSSDIPIYIQIRNQIVLGIAEGHLTTGEKLPTIRALSEECGINMMTVSKAYQLLKSEGYIVTDRRSGASVAGSSPTQISEATMKALRICIYEMRIAGMSEEDLIRTCRTIFREGKIE
jgi:DNA-binding transcriptional regulator YhcF (GntR family)